jgi:hypothetical protein
MKRKEKENKRKSRKERKRMRNYADAIRPEKSPMHYDEECEYYREEQERFEEQYDDEQCAYYHQSYIEEALNDIRKRLYQRSRPARTLIKARQMGEGNAATKGAEGRTSDGDPNHHLRDGATARAKEEGRQEEEGDNED